MTRRMSLLVVGILIVATVAFVGAMMTPAQAFFNCKIVSCPAPQCEDNQHLQTPPGQCCPVCVNN